MKNIIIKTNYYNVRYYIEKTIIAKVNQVYFYLYLFKNNISVTEK